MSIRGYLSGDPCIDCTRLETAEKLLENRDYLEMADERADFRTEIDDRLEGPLYVDQDDEDQTCVFVDSGTEEGKRYEVGYLQGKGRNAELVMHWDPYQEN